MGGMVDRCRFETGILAISVIIRRLAIDRSRFCLSAGSSAWAGLYRYEREASYLLDGDLNVQIRPIQAVSMQLRHMFELCGGGGSKSGKIDKRNKDLAGIGQQPESMRREMGDGHSRKRLASGEGVHSRCSPVKGHGYTRSRRFVNHADISYPIFDRPSRRRRSATFSPFTNTSAMRR
jgi:hypothetical protein